MIPYAVGFFKVLSDPQKRAIYDQYGEEGLTSQVPPPGAGGFSGGSDGGASFRFNGRSADDIFSEFFGFTRPFGDSRGAGPSNGFRFAEDVFSSNVTMRKAAPIERQLPCSLEDLYKGITKKMKISRDVLDSSGSVFQLHCHELSFKNHPFMNLSSKTLICLEGVHISVRCDHV